jgi:hypothetical protein
MPTAVLVIYADDGSAVTVQVQVTAVAPPGPTNPPQPPVIS